IGGGDTNGNGVLKRWNGTAWDLAADVLDGPIYSIAIVGSDTYVGGNFTSAGGDPNIQYVAKLLGTNWTALRSTNLNGPVFAIAAINNTLYVGGDFTNAAGNANANFIAKLDGTTWTNLGTGVWRSDGSNGTVRTIAVRDNDLFVGGDFNIAGGDTNANAIAVWDQKRWSTISGGLTGGPPNCMFGMF